MYTVSDKVRLAVCRVVLVVVVSAVNRHKITKTLMAMVREIVVQWLYIVTYLSTHCHV